MCKVLSIASGLIVGAMLGAGLVLLLTPRSGADTRRMLQERIQAIRVEGQQAAETRRLELTSRLEALKRPQS